MNAWPYRPDRPILAGPPLDSRLVSAEGLERNIARIAAGIIGEEPGPDEQLPLDSLAHAELVFAIEEDLGVRLPDQVSLRTVAEASEAVRRAAAGDGSAAPLREGIGHLQWIAQGVLRSVLGPYYRFTATGTEHVPERGAVVLASNHDSLLDIPFLVVACPRPVWFMAKRELFRGPVATWFFHVMGGFPVDRAGPDLLALRAALAVVRSGRVLAMYPEGTRSRDFLPFLPGAAWVALSAGAPLLPVGIRGTADAMPRGSRLPRRARIRMAFGEPVALPREDDPRARLERARKVTDELRAEVERLARGD